MTDATERPLVTFAVIAYNQERYIREAIEGAFAQTYQPLEIILSDDCSPDRTFEIMVEMAAAYQGPHKVVLNHNEKNMRLVPHIDRVMELVSGELIVVNAGDDISMPERVMKVAEAWLKSDRQAKLIHSSARQIGLAGEFMGIRRPPERTVKEPTPVTVICREGHVIGATAAWDRAVYEEFGPLGAKLSTEDRVLPFRATLLGKIVYIDEPLVSHRTGGISSHVGRLSARDYLFGISHKLRKWTLEIDHHVLDRFEDRNYPDKLEIEDTCRSRALRLKFQVDLAEGSLLQRVALAPQAVQLAACSRSIVPIKHWLRYVFVWPYILYSDWKQGRKSLPDTPVSANDPKSDP